MATINKNGTPGTNGTSGASPTAGTNGGDATFTQNGQIGADSTTVNAIGGLGGAGGNGTGVPGANGGNGGNASITLNGNIFNAPASTTVAVQLNATGGNGGAGGTGTTPGTQGKGGNATIMASGNIFQPNKVLTSIELDAFAVGGTGSTFGNASSTINGNIFQTSKAVTTVTLDASATGSGTNNATLNGNIVQGNINNVNLYADAANGTATINGNIVQTNATNTGIVSLEASGSHIAITNNKFTLGLQELDFAINAASPYDVTITGNTLKGLGANTFKFFDNDLPGPNTDTVSINLATQTMVFDSQATNAIMGFSTIVGGGSNAIYILTGDDNANTLTGGNLNDTLTGGKGNDALNGGNGIDTAVFSGTFAQYTIAVNPAGNGTVTDNVAGRDGTDTLTSIERLQFADGTFNTGTGIFTGVNHAPVLDASKSPALASEPINSPAPVGAVGTLVSSLVDFAVPAGQVDNVTDVDPGAQLGIALTGTDTANGTWYFSTNNGANWTAVGAVSDSSALLLAADANTRLYFAPNIGFSGTDNSAITFRAWDQTTGSNGQSGVNVSGVNNGGSTAFSTANDTASLTITAVMNTAPVLDASKSPTLAPELEDAGSPVNGSPVGTLVSSLVDFAVPAGQVDNVTDPDAGAQLGIALTGTDTANGTWYFSTNNGTTWSAVGAVSDSSALLLAADANTRIYFAPSANFNGTDNSAITFRAWDQTTGTNGQSGVNVSGVNNGGTTAFSTASDTAALTITSVNDAPAGTNATLTTLEDTPYIFAASDFGFTDPNDSPANSLMAVKITTLPTSGILKDNGVPVLAGAFVPVADITGGLLTFTPAANANGLANSSFTFQVQDNGGTANGGVNLDQSPNTITFNVTSVNDAPVGTPGTVTTLEDTAYTFATSDFGFTDPNDTPTNALKAVEITTLPANGSLKDNGVAVTAGQFVTASDIASGLLVFTPAANANGAGYGNFTFQVQDTGGTANGGQDTDTTPRLLTLNVTSVNDAPAGTDKVITTFEDTTYALATSDFGFTDPNDSPANSLLNVKITTLPTSGTLMDNGVPVAAGASVSAAHIAGGLVTFTPAPNASGPASFTFQVQDNGGTANGGVDLDQSPNTITLNVFPVNDAPAGTNKIVTAVEDTPYTFATSDFGFTDPNDTPANALKAVKITTLPANGSLTDNGVAVTAGQFVSATDIAGGLLVFTPAANANGAGYGNFTFQVQDDGGTSHGGVDLDQSPNSITLNVTPVNDAPVANNDAYSTDFNTPLNIAASGVLGNDTDVDGDPLHVDLASVVQPANGAVTVNANGSFTYTPNANFSGVDTFTYQANDGTVDSNAATVSVTVNPGMTFTSPPAALVGGPNDDTFIPTAGTTSIDGMGNTAIGDTVVFSNATSGVTANLAPGVQDFTGSGLGMTSLTNIENLTGSSFDDFLTGDGGPNKLSGGDGNDTLFATTGGDTLNGGNGNDTADFSNATGNVSVHLATVGSQNVGGGIGPITLTNIENLTGGDFDDNLQGDSGNNIIDGGAGTNTVSYYPGTTNGLVVDLTMGASSGGGTGNDTLYNIQNVVGTAFNDTLIGDSGDNTLAGEEGNDILYGHGGTNFLVGGLDTDVAYYSGREASYASVSLGAVSGGPENVNDTLIQVERLKFLAPSHVADVDNGNIVSDANGTGDLIIQSNTTGNLSIQLQPSGPTVTVTGVGANWTVVGTGQFNPDADRGADVLLQDSSNGQLEVITDLTGGKVTNTLTIQPGDANFVTLTGDNSLPATWKAVTTGDFNGDAASDVLLQNQATGNVQIMFLNTSAGETPGTVDGISAVATPGANWKVIAAGDFNSDGKSDILWQNTSTKQVEIYEMNGASVINRPTAQAATGLTAIGTGDFNGDGNSDILFKNASGQAVVWFMNGDSHVGTKTVAKPTAASTWSVSGAEDVDGNGYSDIIWTNTATGIVGASEFSAPSGPASATAVSVPMLTSFSPSQHLVASTGGG